MLSTKLVNRIMLGSVAFCVSFGLGLLTNRSWERALLTGLITIPACYAAYFVSGRRGTNQEKLLRNKLPTNIKELVSQREQLHRSLYLTHTTLKQLEASVNTLQIERSQLLNRVSELHNQREGLNHELIALHRQKRQIEEESYNLQAQVQIFENQQTELSQTLSSKTVEVERSEAKKKSLKIQLEQLQAQLIKQQHNKTAIEKELILLEMKRRQYDVKYSQTTSNIADDSNEEIIAPKNLPDEWQQFMEKLPEHNLGILNAIVKQDNASATLKSIAEENLTMPELLINSINELALDTIGDLIIEPGTVPPQICDQEYITKVKQILNNYAQSSATSHNISSDI